MNKSIEPKIKFKTDTPIIIDHINRLKKLREELEQKMSKRTVEMMQYVNQFTQMINFITTNLKIEDKLEFSEKGCMINYSIDSNKKQYFGFKFSDEFLDRMQLENYRTLLMNIIINEREILVEYYVENLENNYNGKKRYTKTDMIIDLPEKIYDTVIKHLDGILAKFDSIFVSVATYIMKKIENIISIHS